MNTILTPSIRLDWVSFTVEKPTEYNESEYHHFIGDVVFGLYRSQDWWAGLFDLRNWRGIKAHKPYSFAIRSTILDGLVVMWSPKRAEMLIELQGRFCEKHTYLSRTIAHDYARFVTRLDVCVDVETDLDPIAVWGGVANKTYSVNQSKDGQTVYIGSPKSEKMMRIYKYNPPHPRSHLLRSEVVFRRSWAKKLAFTLNHSDAMAQFCADYWRTQSAIWWSENIAPLLLDVNSPNLVSAPERRGSDKSTSSTLAWLHAQVRPAIARSVRDGASLDEILDALGLYWDTDTSIRVK